MITIILVAVAMLFVVAAVVLIWWRKRPRQLKPDRFQGQWHDLQSSLKDKSGWNTAVIEADKLLDEALKKKRIGGKNMGERLVKAQRMLTDNDGVWFGHKLRGQLDHDPAKKLKEADVKAALLGIRQALKDLGALPEAKPNAKSSTIAPPKPAATPKPPKSTPAPAKSAPRPTAKTPARARAARPARKPAKVVK